MEDLWLIRRSGIEVEELADFAEYNRLLSRFRIDEESRNQRCLLFGGDSAGEPEEPSES